MCKIKILIPVLFICLNFYTATSQSKQIKLDSAIEYFYERKEAISLVKNEHWQESILILEKLSEQYQNDADLYYLLGICYFQVRQYQQAISALKKALNLGGTILREVPTGSAPSNDIMIKIAEAYAEHGDRDNAIFWLQKGFASRYDEKPFLKNSPSFKSLNEDERFIKLFGIAASQTNNREEAWVRDINYFEKRINELHYSPNNVISMEALSNEILEIKINVASLSDEQIVVKLMKVVGSLGNGHNLIIPTSPKQNPLKKLPIQFYHFNDGIYIVNTAEGLEQWIGYKVKLIEKTPIKEVLQKTNTLNARDNDMQILWLGPYYMCLPDVLKEIGIISNTNKVTLTLSDVNGKTESLTLTPITWSFNGFPKLPKLKKKKQPMFLSKIEKPYWYKFNPENNSIYIQFNVVSENRKQTLKDFNLELRNLISQKKPNNLILDLRHNHGGNGSILPPMLKTIINYEVMNPDSFIFVLMGRETFSAAHNLLTDITKYTNAILVGEPSGSKPNHIGEAGWFQLPYSGLMGLISTQFHQTSFAEDNRKWIAPHVPVGLSSIDYFSGIDKPMNTVIELIELKNGKTHRH